jgi:isopentenyl-diphosphate delta-isomerase
VSEQILMVVTPDDDLVEYAPRGECHLGQGRLHRALAGVIFNDRGQLLLQRRKSRLWDDYWDITAATHPLHGPNCDESYDDAMQRCLIAEWNVSVPMETVLAFIYFEAYGQQCENEYCVLMVGRYSGPVHPHPDHAYDMRWVDFDECAADLARDPGKYTPWARLAIQNLEGHPRTRGEDAAA